MSMSVREPWTYSMIVKNIADELVEIAGQLTEEEHRRTELRERLTEMSEGVETE